MHTKDFARTLRAFAELADFDRSHEIYGFAAFIDQGGNDTIFSRLKSLRPSTNYPLRLKDSLQTLGSGFKAAGATKQAKVFEGFLTLFAGRAGATLPQFIGEISISTQVPNLAAPRFKAAKPDLAKEISRRLIDPTLDDRAFASIMEILRSPAEIDTATLALVANFALGNCRVYRDRKMALSAIQKYFGALLSHNEETCQEPG